MSSPTRHTIAFALLAGAVFVAGVPHDTPTHFKFYSPFRASWYHPESHPVHALFKRDVATPGSQAWTSQYPAVYSPPIPEAVTPKSWLDALQAAEQGSQIPNIPIPTQSNPSQNPSYGGQDPGGNGAEICSSTAQCRGPDDVWDGPNGHLAIGFDDGPSDGSAMLYQFLQEQNQPATHFMIGINILNNYALFNQAYSTLKNDIAVHTWTHPYMTTMNNSQVVAQLGWTMQIIHDATGGRVPRYWRPPYGDSDNRIRAIAKEVFGLTQIDWNQDSADWSIATGHTTLPKVVASLNSWYSGPKTPGLIVLEHELDNNTSGAFIQTYAGIKANNWTVMSTVQLFDGAYQNVDKNDGTVLSMVVAGPIPTPTPTGSTSASSAENTSASTSTGSASPNNANIDQKSGSIRTHGVAVSKLLLLVVTLLSAFR